MSILIIGQTSITHYEVVKEFPNGGRTLEEIKETPAVEAKEAYDEYENVLVYIPYTEQEIIG